MSDREPPSGTVTFLFTDLEGSTRLWEQHPEAMKDALARHDEILRQAIAAHDGHIVKMTGDGVHAAFGTADAGALTAVAVQQAVMAEQWGDIGALRVRVGIHTGPAEAREGDYYGTSVNKAARLMSTAHGGQILVSLATEELLRDAMPGACEVVDLGEHRLRDLSRAERVYQLVAPGLATEFPSLRSLDAYAGNLPVQLSSFVGRDDELAAVSKQLTVSRLVTRTGVGGVGKTRLAIQVAAELMPRFADGVWLCELALARDADTLTEVVGTTLGVNRRPGLSAQASIVDVLRNREVLLVLDNCEHLVQAASDLTLAVLRSCPGVRVLATSREGLGVEGEQTWPLRSLPVQDSLELFAERAAAARPGFAVDSANTTSVTDVCRRLDGIPLAIELAAARVVALSPADIGARLDERFRLLAGGRRSAVERHQTLRATVDWSYSLLDDTERTVFERLSVFSGSSDARAAEAVCSGEGIEAWDVLDALTSLVAKSMVTNEDGPSGTVRYRLLETMREYAGEHLRANDDVDHWRRRHAERYTEFAEEAGPALTGPDELAWRPRLHAEEDNLRGAVVWSLDSKDADDGELAVRIVAALAHECINEPLRAIGTWAERAAERSRASTPGRRTAVLGAAAWTAMIGRAEFEFATDLAREALQDGVPPDCPAPQVALSALVGPLAQAQQEEEARLVVTDAREQLDQAGASTFARAFVECAAGFARAVAGDLARAREHSELAIPLARTTRNPSLIASSLFGIALATLQPDPETALAAIDESIALTREGASEIVLGFVLAMRAKLRALSGERFGALADLREAIATASEKADLIIVVTALGRGAEILARLQEPEPAAALAGFVAGPVQQLDSLPREERTDRDEALARARLALGVAAYDAAVARGTAMSLEDATAYALAELDRLVAAVEDDDA
ncbi:MAG TPA: adenylate/guanylate cyclase domain-containing protein [Acidimicrobiia bacterium]|nr:adenylate/guanylate cyclase domain-containing protein [Acidimicrobiia bacterium]